MTDVTLKNKLRNGAKVSGCFMMMPSADVAEILSHSGFDFLLIDHEHGSGSFTDAIAQMRAMQNSGAANMVRAPSNDPAYVKRLLDGGAQNILCPNVETAEQAEAFVQACRYPPRGARGAGGGIRAARYGHDMAYYQPASEENLLIAVQIETERGVQNIGEIAAVAGIDMLVIGPRDLSASMGLLNRFDDPGVKAVYAAAEAKILASGKYLASVIYPGKTAQEMFAKGYHMLIVGTDVGFLVQGAQAAIDAARK